MARSIWKKSLVTSLAWAGLAWAQQPVSPYSQSSQSPQGSAASAPKPAGELVITVQEQGKAAQKCKVIKTWKTPEGATAYQVMALDTHEILTVVENGQPTVVPGARPGSSWRAMATRIFHWGQSQTPPSGTPMPPVEVVQTPAPAAKMPASKMPAPLPSTVTQPSMTASSRGIQPAMPGQTIVMPAQSTVVPAPYTPTQTTQVMPAPYTPTQTTQVMAPPQVTNMQATTTSTVSKPVTSSPMLTTQVTSTTSSEVTSTESRPFARLFHRNQQEGTQQTVTSVPPAPSGRWTTRTMATSPDPVTSTPSSVTTADSGSTKSKYQQLVQVLPSDDSDKLPPITEKPEEPKKPAIAAAQAAPAKLPDAVKQPTVSAGPPAAVSSVAKTQTTEKHSTLSDWRKSWGKADDHKSVAAPSKTETTQTAAKTEKADKDMTESKNSLPHSQAKDNDPLRSPVGYNEKTAASVKSEPAKQTDVVSEPAEKHHGLFQWMHRHSESSSSNTAKTEVESAKPVVVASPKTVPTVTTTIMTPAPVPSQAPMTMPTTSSIVTPVPQVQVVPQVPLGAGSVLGSGEASGGGVHYVPVPIVTVPDVTHPPMPPAPQVPQAPQPISQRPMMAPSMGMQANKPFGQGPTTTDPSSENAFTSMPTEEMVAKAQNAFTTVEPGMPLPGSMPSGPGRSVPPMMAQRGQPGMMPGMGSQVGMTPGVQQATYQGMAQAAQGVAMVNLQQMLGVLHDSLYPSQREWAVEGLTTMDWRQCPQVVPALLTAAKEDPAATVRASCVQAIAKMNINTMPVVQAVQALKADPDPRVRQAVDQAMMKLVPGHASVQKPALQPTGYAMPAGGK